MKLRGEASEGGSRYILRNEANKSFIINKSVWKEGQKATRKRSEITNREVKR